MGCIADNIVQQKPPWFEMLAVELLTVCVAVLQTIGAPGTIVVMHHTGA